MDNANKTVRAKFTLTKLDPNTPGTSATCTWQPVYDPTIEEDRRFSQATPSGALTMLIDNSEVLRGLAVGQQFYLNMTLIPVNDGAQVGRTVVVGAGNTLTAA